MRWHPKKQILCCICLLLLIVLYKLTWNDRWGKRPYIRNEIIDGVENSDGGIYWLETNEVDKVSNNGNKNKVINGFDNVLTERNGDLLQSESEKIYFNLNVEVSDHLPLNRKVPDSRPEGCAELSYPKDLPTTSVVIPFHNELPSVLLRTVHSLINGTPDYILTQIILVDDASTLNSLKSRLDKYVNVTFPEGVVKIIRLKSRQGLIRARLEGFKYVTSDVVSFFDSHMEVNKKWIQPLLNEIVKNPMTVAMAQLDYIQSDSFEYKFFKDYRTRYGFKWNMEFFETFFRPDQLLGKTETDPLPGVLMVGPGFAVKSQYFRDVGMYDSGMSIWGGENIEFAWRVWMCGGRLLHVPCSRVGHIERAQPYSFPQGRRHTELHNYKRAAEVWMGPFKKYVYDALPGIVNLKAGNIDERLKVKAGLKCKDFKWFLQNIWPELLPYEDVGPLWGQVKTKQGECLDNKNYLFKDPYPLELNDCTQIMMQQGFALTPDGYLRTTLHCVVAYQVDMDLMPFIQNCMLDVSHKWSYDKHHRLVHLKSNTCLEVMYDSRLVLQPCKETLDGQQWLFIQGKIQG